ncbi:MAG: DMT family transporter [Pseudomonadota bacterium]
MEIQTRVGLGILLALIGGLSISIDIPMIRLAEANPWVTMLMRGIGLSSVLGLILIFGRKYTDTPTNPFDDRNWVEIGVLFGLSSIFFTISVFHTSTANLVFILAFNPMLAALLSWWMFGERPDFVTWLAIVLTIVGITIIVAGGVDSGALFGNLTSLATAFLLALSITRSRQSGKDLSLSGCLGGMVTALFALPLAYANFEMPTYPMWLFINVFVLVPISGFSLTLAPRFIPAAQVAMFFLLETVLAPVWVWLIFAEIPTNATLIGGMIVLLTVAGHSFWQVWYMQRPMPKPA